ncbi:MAG: hypothetical protein K2X38_19965 [Gemmataceae bacterium]|nr:hypothetical protein [Gemmataceae bacterium]
MSVNVKENPVYNRLADLFATDLPNAMPDPERHPKGTFRNGNRGGPGNPFARRVAKLRQAMLEECAEEDLRGITRAMINLAKNGDKAAAKLVYQYALGKPAQQVDPDRIDEDEFDVLKGMAVPGAVTDAVLNHSTPADTVCRLVQGLWPLLMKATAAQVEVEAEERREFNEQMDKDNAEWEALPAEERLRQYNQCGTPPSDELVEEAAKERAAREAKAQAAPSPNGVLRGDKFINLSEMAAKAETVAPQPSPNGVLPGDQGVRSRFEHVDKLVPTGREPSRDGK